MRKSLLATAIILALAATPTVFAKGKPTVELGNNLSFATKFVGTAGAPATRLTCDPFSPTSPRGPQCVDFPGWWCQKTEAVWQAVCGPGALGTVVAASWGANLLPGASLKAGRPIRVEMTLTEVGNAANGYVVQNLTPDLEDRFATYGTQGVEQPSDYVVFDSGATLKIERCADMACAVPTSTVLPETPITAELNSVGKVVYGYNWGTKGKTTAPTAGIYKLTFTANATVIGSAPGGAYQCAAPDNCTYTIINVLPAGKPSNPGGGED
jgi:hypothetical protein